MAEGKRVHAPHLLRVHLIAARYGQTPAQVREWPADDFAHALEFLEVTG